MTSITPFLALPYIQGGQAQKHITHNTALQRLDALVHLSVRALAGTPGTSLDGDRYAVSGSAGGAFAGQEGMLAIHEGGAWVFETPQIGWRAFNEATGGLIVFDGTGWAGLGTDATEAAQFGISTTADDTNRLAVASDASLFTHAGSDHRMTLNKAQEGDTASVMFQTGYQGRAEIGTVGSDDVEIRVSSDGMSFRTALRIDGESGAVSLPQTPGSGLIANSTGAQGAVNYPATLSFDAGETPQMAGAFVHQGYASGALEMDQPITLDPHRVYRVSAYLRQEAVAGDWSGFVNGDRHRQHIGLRCYDADGLAIEGHHHMRYRSGEKDSLTVLSQPLTPGDMVVHVADAGGWNDANPDPEKCGLIVFGYRGASGQYSKFYSRIEAGGLFAPAGVDKTGHVITLSAPVPAALGNPDDPNGTWPVGTLIANRSYGWGYKFAVAQGFVPPEADSWYQIDNMIGGVDISGTNAPNNFPPGAVSARAAMFLNDSNGVGGVDGFADTGVSQRVWITGVQAQVDPCAALRRESVGTFAIYRVEGNVTDGSVGFVQSSQSVTEV